MPYIGNQPAEQFTSFATQEFSTSATTSYTLDHAVTNENEIALFVNNVRQQPGSGKAYTATGTALTLSAATASTDTMYCVFLGRALQTVNPATNSITAAMVSNDLISGKTALASEPADTDEFLVSDAGTLKRIDYSLIKGGGITHADGFRLSANANSGTTGQVTSNWERIDDASFGGIGTGLTESSGTFSFPSTGIYQIFFMGRIAQNESDAVCNLAMAVTTNNSSYDEVTLTRMQNPGYEESGFSGMFMVDVTDTSNVKFYMKTSSFSSGTVLRGDTDITYTGIFSVRLGDT